MILKMDFAVVDNAMLTVSSIVNDKMLQDEHKNLVIWIKDGVVNFVGSNGNIISATKVACAVNFEGAPNEETFVQLRAKDINDVLAALKGLKRTRVESVEFVIKENEAILLIHEVALDDEMQNADTYKQTSKYRITKSRLKDIIKNDIQKIVVDTNGINITSADALVFINALLPTVAKETREATMNVMFGTDYYYSVLSTYVALMGNKLSPEFSGFRLPNSVVAFLKSFISSEDSFSFCREEKGNGLVHLTVKNSTSVALIKCADMAKAFDVTNFVSLPVNGIELDKMYLIDVIKRISLSSDAVFIEVKVIDGVGSFSVVSKSMTQSVPVIRAKGDGEYSFSIRAELLSSVVFSHASYFSDTVFMYFEKGAKGNIVMACTDNLQLWHTKMMGLSSAKGDFAWS